MFRNPANATGLSRKSGSPIREPSDLPEHRVEVHVFRNADAASAFVDGLSLAGNPNSLSWDWETGTEEDNRTVLVARLDEPRPDGPTPRDCLPVIRHEPTRHDYVSHVASMERIYADRDAREREDKAVMAPLRTALTAAGIKVGEGAMRWLRTKNATLTVGPSSIKAEFHDTESQRNTPAIESRMAALAEGAGFTVGERSSDYVGGPYAGIDEAVAAVLAFDALLPRFEAIRREEWHREFMESMRMTGPRKRFLAAGAEDGIRVWSERRSIQAEAGGHRIKAGEFHSLVRAGWITEQDKGRSAVTPEGLEAAGIEAKAPAP